MNRMKTFLIYLLLFVGFYIFTDVIASVSLSKSYAGLECTKKETSGYEVTVSDAKATSVSGYVQGTIKQSNETQETKKYMQIDLYSKYGNRQGRKYINISNVTSEHSKDFKINFEASEIATYQITLTDEVQSLLDVQQNMVSKGYLAFATVGALIVLYYVL